MFYAKHSDRLTIPSIRIQYRKMQSDVRELIDKRKGIYYRKKFEQNRFNLREQWRTVNSILGKHKTKEELKSLRLPDNTVICENVQISNSFNMFFKDIAEKSVPDVCIELNNSNREFLLEGQHTSSFFSVRWMILSFCSLLIA